MTRYTAWYSRDSLYRETEMATPSTRPRGQTLPNDPRLQPFIIPNVRPTGTTLGGGSYGSVEELTINGFVCAGKKIYEILLQMGNYGIDNIAQRYVEECQLMSDLRHPHLVQFMGVCFLSDSSLPVLVMERLLISLDDLLESTPDVPLALKRSILADVCKGLVYLHNHIPSVIHRDLTAKNVLLNSAMVAKISDLGNSRIIDLRPGQLARTLSRIPGTMVYMPPEAFDDTSRYGTRLDLFSFGHLALFTITQVFPGTLKPSTYPNPNDPDSLIARNEVERREDYIDQLHRQLGEGHPLVRMIKQCLHNVPSWRPSTEEVLQQLEGMRDQIHDPYHHMTKLEMMMALKQKDSAVQQLTTQEKGFTDGSMQQKLQQLQIQMQQLQLEMDGKNRLVDSLRGQLQEKETQLHQMETVQQGLQPQSHQLQAQPISGLTLPLQLQWKRCKGMPYGRYDPHAVVIRRRVYVGGGDGYEKSVVMVYDPHSDRWSLLPPYQFLSFGLAVMNDQLVLVGGRDGSYNRTNRLGVWNEESHQWTEPYPPMMTACSRPSVVTREKWLVVAGGIDGYGDALDRVEILNTTTRQWYFATPLLQKCFGIKLALVGDTLYLMGGLTSGGKASKEVFKVSLSALIRQATEVASRAATYTLWQTLPPAPLGYSAPLILHGSLLAIGGEDKKEKPRSSIYLYQPGAENWVKVGDLPTARSSCVSILLSSGDLDFLVLGGESTARVDKATLQ